jgi:hypothetical protein
MVRLHDIEPRSPDWHVKRAPLVGGSDASAVTAKPRGKVEAVGRRDLRIHIVLSRLGGHPRQSTFTTPAMQLGIDTEDQARAVYEMTTRLMVETPGYITSDALPGLGYSPDGCIGEVGLLEIKCPKDHTHWHTLSLAEENKDAQVTSPLLMVPKAYHSQLLHALLVSSDRDWIDFVSYSAAFPESLQLYVSRVHRSEVVEEVCAYQAAVETFLSEVDATVAEIQHVVNSHQ